MPDPIQSSSNSSSYQPTEADSAAVDPGAGLMCLAPAQPSAASSPSSPANSSSSAPASPAVASLVARFSPPSGSHPPVEPSLSKAAWHCSWELANAALDIGDIAQTDGLVSKLLSGAHGVSNLGSAVRCIQRDEAEQVATGERANQSADCVREGAVPLLQPDGKVVCAAQ